MKTSLLKRPVISSFVRMTNASHQAPLSRMPGIVRQQFVGQQGCQRIVPSFIAFILRGSLLVLVTIRQLICQLPDQQLNHHLHRLLCLRRCRQACQLFVRRSPHHLSRHLNRHLGRHSVQVVSPQTRLLPTRQWFRHLSLAHLRRLCLRLFQVHFPPLHRH
jgi:hypothetical protein